MKELGELTGNGVGPSGTFRSLPWRNHDSFCRTGLKSGVFGPTCSAIVSMTSWSKRRERTGMTKSAELASCGSGHGYGPFSFDCSSASTLVCSPEPGIRSPRHRAFRDS